MVCGHAGRVTLPWCGAAEVRALLAEQLQLVGNGRQFTKVD